MQIDKVKIISQESHINSLAAITEDRGTDMVSVALVISRTP